MSELILLHVSGDDAPGLLTRLTGILAEADVPVLDINQITIHETLALSLLVELPAARSRDVLKELLFETHHLGLRLRMSPVAEDEYERWVGQQGKPRSILTVMSRGLSALQLSAVGRIIHEQGLNVDFVHRLSGRRSLRDQSGPRHAVVELSLRGEPADERTLKGALLERAAALSFDFAIQRDDIYRRNRRMVCFDMDSTLIQTEVIDELAREAGVGEKVAAITEAAMRGELDFDQSFRRRVAMLKGLDASVLERVAARLPLTEGVERLFAYLRHVGLKTAILSGGFTYFGEELRRRLKLDHVYANALEIVDGKVTGEVTGTIVNGARKAALLRELAAAEGIHVRQVIAVGDGANDLPMLEAAGLGVAFHAKPAVRAGAGQTISTLGLDALLYLLGVHDRDADDYADESRAAG